MADQSEVAYCGLFCGDCVIRKGRLAALSLDLLDRMRTPEFQKLAEGLPELKPELFDALREYPTCCCVLEAMSHLDCEKVCKAGGGSAACPIRGCCQAKGAEGCWSCGQFETCETLSWLNPVHQDAHRRNIRMIREQGMDEFLKGEKHW